MVHQGIRIRIKTDCQYLLESLLHFVTTQKPGTISFHRKAHIANKQLHMFSCGLLQTCNTHNIPPTASNKTYCSHGETNNVLVFFFSSYFGPVFAPHPVIGLFPMRVHLFCVYSLISMSIFISCFFFSWCAIFSNIHVFKSSLSFP